MEIKEFIEATGKLEKYFDREYTEEQRKIMYETFKKTSKTQYLRGVKYCLENCKYLPKIVDIREGISHLVATKENKPKIEFIKCENCEQGFIQYFREIKDGDRILKYSYVALCNCENGLKQKEINGYNIPFINEVMKIN